LVVQGIDSCDDSIDCSLRAQKRSLEQILANNGVYGSMKANGLEPTRSAIPTLSQHTQTKNVFAGRLPSINYLIAHYVNVFSICLLLKYFDAPRAENDRFSAKSIRKYLSKNGDAFERAFIGTAPAPDDNTKIHRTSTLILEIFFDEDKHAEFGLNESRRHKLLRLL